MAYTSQVQVQNEDGLVLPVKPAKYSGKQKPWAALWPRVFRSLVAAVSSEAGDDLGSRYSLMSQTVVVLEHQAENSTFHIQLPRQKADRHSVGALVS